MVSPDKDVSVEPKKSQLESELQSTTSTTESLPRYYDSEPSSLPPQYHKTSNTAPSNKRQSAPQQQQFAGASASSVSAMLASPSLQDHEQTSGRSWRQRWKDLKRGYIINTGDQDDLYRPDVGSTAHWNVFGARIDGGESKKRNWKK